MLAARLGFAAKSSTSINDSTTSYRRTSIDSSTLCCAERRLSVDTPICMSTYYTRYRLHTRTFKINDRQQ